MSPATEPKHDAAAGPDDVGGDGNRDERVEALPAGHGDRDHAHQHAGGGPDVGEQVVGVGLQRDRAVRARRAQQDERDAQVHQRRHHGDREAEAHLLECARMQEPVDRRDRDADRRDQDQRALHSRGKVLGLAVAVRRGPRRAGGRRRSASRAP